MKHTLPLIGLTLMSMISGTHAQTTNTELTDKVKTTPLVVDLEFEQVASCEALNTRISDWLKKHKELREPRKYITTHMEKTSFGSDMSTAAPTSSISGIAGSTTKDESVSSSTTDYSTTNIQKKGIDEPDIYKTDGDMLYYYNNKEKTIHIIQSPLDRTNATITLSDLKILSNIAIPDDLHGSQLYIQDQQLIIVGNRYKDAYRTRGWFAHSNTTFVARYDVSNSVKPSLIDYTEHDGYLVDSRFDMEDDTLMVMTSVSPSYHTLAETKNIADSIKLPKSVIVSRNGKTLSSRVASISCDQTFLLLPSDDTLKHTGQGPEFTTVHLLDIKKNQTTHYASFGSTAQIHTSADYLYFAQNIWMPKGRYSCPVGSSCIMPTIRGGNNNTLIHGFDRKGTTLSYQGSTLVEGSPLHDQYSMDEHNGQLRFLTQVRSPAQNTHLWVLDQQLKLQGSLQNIQKDERFQGARFIGDKLYLITFEQVDPLFVIDLSDSTKPTIIGELKMPGWSNYIHPLGAESKGIQHLLGVGYDAGENQRGGTSRKGVKLDLYTIDYTKKETADSLCGSLEKDSEPYGECLKHVDTDRIRVERLDSLVFGDEQSYTPVANNPRHFVLRTDTNQLTLPLLEKKKAKEIKRCTVVYEGDKIAKQENCRNETTYQDTFAGYKVIDIDPSQGDNALGVSFERNILDTIRTYLGKQDARYGLGQWIFDDMGPRVAFAGDAQLFLTNYLIDVVVGKQSTTLPLVQATQNK